MLGSDDKFRESAPRQKQLVESEDLSGELQGEPQGFKPTESRDDAEAWKDFWSVKGDFIYRHHIKPRVQLHVPKGETFPTPLKYIDVTRSKHTNLDVLQENRIDDCWNVDANESLSESWTGFTKFTLLKDHSQYQCETLSWSCERTQPWMFCWRAVLMIIGTLMVTGAYRNRGLVSGSSQY